jgi:hypothetical protein
VADFLPDCVDGLAYRLKILMPRKEGDRKMDDMDIVDQIALIAGRLANLAGQYRRAMDADNLAADLKAQVSELSGIRRRLITSKSAAPSEMVGNPVRL